MRLRRLLVASCMFVPGLVVAQPVLDSWENLGQLRVGQKVEVVDAKMKPLRGRFVGYSGEAVRLLVGKDEVSVDRSNVVSIKNREGPRRARNAWLGLGIGAGVGAVVGLIQGKTYHEEGETGVFMLVWTPIGAGVGAGVGAMLPARDVTIYRVRDLPPPRDSIGRVREPD